MVRVLLVFIEKIGLSLRFMLKNGFISRFEKSYSYFMYFTNNFIKRLLVNSVKKFINRNVNVKLIIFRKEMGYNLVKEVGFMDVLTISRYVVNKSIEINVPVTNLKLQKLLYYIQAMSLTETGNKAFEESIINWKYGPVVIEAYEEFKVYGRKLIEEKIKTYTILTYKNKFVMEKKEFEQKDISIEERKIIDCVIEAYRDMTANKLVIKTHKEGPWRDTHLNDVIDADLITSYYKRYPKKLLA